MIKNPQLIDNLHKKEIQKPLDFNQKVKRYEQMYNIARKLNPEIGKQKNSRHLNHLIKLAAKFQKIAGKENA